MLMLSKLHSTLSQVLSLPYLHTAVLLTVSGDLVSSASDPLRQKDDIRIIVGVAGEVWQETKEQGCGMVDSEKLGRIVVLPVDDAIDEEDTPFSDDRQPLMLLALNATEAVDWEELQTKGAVLASHLAKPLCQFREFLEVKSSPPTPSATSPEPIHT